MKFSGLGGEITSGRLERTLLELMYSGGIRLGLLPERNGGGSSRPFWGLGQLIRGWF